MRRGVALILALLLAIGSLLSLTACNNNRSYDEAEVLASAEELLEGAKMLNSVWYGNGISHIDNSYRNGNYYEADPMHLARLGFSSIPELKEKTLEVFTIRYSEEIFGNKLSAIQDDDVVKFTAKYYQVYEDVAETIPLRIMVYYYISQRPEDKQLYDDRLLGYDYSTLKVTGVKKETLHLSVDAKVANADGEEQTVTVSFNMFEEEYGWRIDSPCFANYNEYLDSDLFK